MALFGRKKTSVPDPDETADARVAPEGEPGVDRPWQRELDGPFDISEQPDLAGRLDFGPLKVPAARGMELRLELEKGSRRVVGVTLGAGGSQVQVQGFAAPRSSGLWQDLRSEITEGIRERKGTADLVDGVLGTEIVARIPAQGPEGSTTYQQARFFGIDGPRWFLRAAVNGPAASQEAALKPLLGLLRLFVVDRGDEPRPPREVLELTPPQQVLDAIVARAKAASGEAGADGAAGSAPTP